MTQFHKLSVTDVHATTEEASAVTFKVPDELKDAFQFKAGQYLTLKFAVAGQEQRRSYSICSSPSHEDELSIGVKRVKNGLVSNHIADKLKVGDVVEVMQPQGLFSVELDATATKKYYLFAAGSGITPILSIARAVLEREANSQVFLIYGNQNQESIMFLPELEELQNKYPDTFHMTHYLSRQKRSLGGLFKKKDTFEYRKGRVDAGAIAWFLSENPRDASSEFYLCGPGPMIQSTLRALKTLGLDADQLHTEYFTTEDLEIATVAGGSTSGPSEGVAAHLTAHLEGEVVELDIEAGKTVLQSLIDEGYNPPYSCESGVCSTCMCKLKQGKVHMKSNMALSDDEVDKGFILSCQSLPLTEDIEIEYLD